MRDRREPFSVVGLILLFAAGILVSAAADEPKSADKDKDKDKNKQTAQAKAAAQQRSPFVQASKGTGSKKAETTVISTEDLERKYGPPSPTRASEPYQEGQDPLARMEQQKVDAADQRDKVSQAEQKVEAARARVADLEQRIRALKNPLLKRPTPPEDAEAMKEWESTGTAGRVERSEGQLQQARQELDQAQQELNRARSSGS